MELVSESTTTAALYVFGSVRSPIFYDNDNTAYYLDPANTGTSLLVAGSVGVSKTSIRSNSILDVNGAGCFGASAYGFYIGTDATGAFLDAGSQLIRMFAGSSEKVRIDASGNLGVGITSLVHKIQAAGLISAGDATYNNNSTFIGAILNNDQTNPGLDLRRWNGGGAGTDNHGATYIATNSAGDTLFYNGLIAANTRATNEKMRISVAGNVGIGTASPSYKLQVTGQTFLSNGVSNALTIQTTVADGNTRDGIYLYENDSQASGRQAISWYNGNTSYYKARLWTQVGGGYDATVFGIDVANDARTVDTRLAIRNGNIGIGTTSPSQKLHVVGIGYSDTDFRAPIFYDSNNTAYYLDPASTSSLNALTMAGAITGALDSTISFVGGACTAASYNYILSGANDGGNKLVIFVNGTTRSADGGVNALTIRNDGGTFVLGIASYLTSILGSSVTINGNVALHAGNYGGYSTFSGVVSSASGGFQTATYAAGRNRIWSFGNSDGYGLAYFQGSGGVGGYDVIGMHFGTATAAASQYQFNAIGSFTASGDVRAPIFYDSGNTAYYLDPANTGTSLLVAGNVGIGTTSPGTLLQVHGSNPFFRISNSASSDQGIKITYGNSDTHGLHLLYNANSALSYIDNTYPIDAAQVWGDILFRQNVASTMTTRMIIKANSGNVGIGTTSPTVKLTVSADVTDADVGQLRLVGSTSSAKMLSLGYQTTSNYGFISALIAGTGYSNLALQPNGGNVGIGTTSPGYKLDITGTGRFTGDLTLVNLIGSYQNTTVYNSANTLSTTPSRGIRAQSSSIQFTDSYAIAPFYTYRSTGDWPVPYGIGWGTGGESSGIFQRYASNGSSFGDMIFYTGNDGFGAFSFRRHTWEGTTYFGAGSGELNTELFRVDWSGTVTASSDFRAPIFYDSNNTAYYIDAASTSILNTIRLAGKLTNNGSVSDDDGFGIYWDSGESTAYAIYREAGSWTNPFPDLRIAFHTGIKLGANASYNGIRFYNDYDMTTQVMSVNNSGDGLGVNNVYVNNSLQADSSLRAPIFYDSNNTVYYLDPANTGTSLLVAGNVGIGTTDFSYTINDNSRVVGSNTNNRLFVSGSIQLLGNNDAIVFGRATSTFLTDEELGFGWGGGWYMTDETYLRVRNNKVLYTTGEIWGSIFKDSNNTAYYINPAGNSIVNSLTFDSSITIYKHNDRNLLIQGGGGTDAGLLGRGSSGQFAFQVYGSGGGDYGFLDGAWAGWDIRKVTGGNLFLNNNNTYYLNPGSLTNLLGLTVANTITGSITGSSVFMASLGSGLNYDNDRTTKRAGLSHYSGYSTGTNRPTTYDYTLQVTDGNKGWEISMDWIATTGPAIYARSLRDCCQNWSSWVRILDSANYSFAANMNQNVRTTDNVTFGNVTGAIFYDSANAAYYLDPNSLSNIRHTIFDIGSNLVGATGIGVLFDGNYTSGQYRHRFRKYDDGAGLPLYVDYAHATANSFTAIARFGGGGTYNSFSVYGTADASGDFRAPIFYDSNNTAYYLDPASTSNLNAITAAGNITAAQYYTANWFRSTTSGNGLYNEATGQHFYSDSVNYWNIASSANAQGIRLRTGGHNGTVRGYFYADTNNDVGLLNQDGSWRLRVVGGDYSLADGSSMRAQLFYDSNDTAYYLDPRSTSVLSGLKLNGVDNEAAGTGSDAILWINKPNNNDWGIRVSGNLEYLLKLEGATSHTYNIQGMANGSEFWRCGTDLLYHNSNIRAPIFYDSNDTSYYLDLNSSGSLIRGRVNITGGHGGSSLRVFLSAAENGAVTGITTLQQWCSEPGNTWDGAGFGYNVDNSLNEAGNVPAYFFGRPNTSFGQAYMRMTTDGNWYFYNTPNGSNTRYTTMVLERTGYVIASNSIRSPIFHDSDNTAYYTDPASTSNLLGLTVTNTITGSITGNAGGSSASCTGNSATTTLATKATRANGDFYIDDNYGNTIVGNYNAARYQGVFAMGNSYKLPADGTTTGSLYGIAWSHPNAGGAAGNLSTHGALILENGSYVAAISSSIRCTGDMRTPRFYDSDNTVYYTDPGSTSNLLGLTVVNTITGSITGNAGGSSTSCTGNAASATTAAACSGNTAGTASSISGFNNPVTSATANTIVYRDGSGHITGNQIFGNYHNSSDDTSSSGITFIMAKFGDNYHRSASAAKVATFISGQTMNIAGSSTSCSGNAASVTDGVYLSTTQSISGVKTFSSAPIATNIAKAWVFYNMNNNTINASYNVSSVTDNGTGVCTVNFSTAMVDANYVVAGTATYGYDDQDIYAMILAVPRRSTAQQAGSCRLATEYIHAAQVYDSVAVRAVFYR